jgi:hypothetical protein
MIVTKLWHLQKPNQLSSINPTDALGDSEAPGATGAMEAEKTLSPQSKSS